MITTTLALPEVPLFCDKTHITVVDVWDVAAAHILYSDKLCGSKDVNGKEESDVGGQRFLITGAGPPLTLQEMRRVIQACTSPYIAITTPDTA